MVYQLLKLIKQISTGWNSGMLTSPTEYGVPKYCSLLPTLSWTGIPEKETIFLNLIQSTPLICIMFKL